MDYKKKKKAIYKQLEMEEENNFKFFHSLVGFWIYNKD